jgi:hypothetical protein
MVTLMGIRVKVVLFTHIRRVMVKNLNYLVFLSLYQTLLSALDDNFISFKPYVSPFKVKLKTP